VNLRKVIPHVIFGAFCAGEVNNNDFACGLRNHRWQAGAQVGKPVLASRNNAEFHGLFSSMITPDSSHPLQALAAFVFPAISQLSICTCIAERSTFC
jgi:hypothetical protein